jgi:hypothetical protein
VEGSRLLPAARQPSPRGFLRQQAVDLGAGHQALVPRRAHRADATRPVPTPEGVEADAKLAGG